jgi:capsular polysaccharide export protein
MNQSFLLLQGVASPFFAELGKALVDEGYPVLKINFCGGDRFFSKKLNQLDYADSLDNLPGFLKTIMQKHQITDMVLFGDTRPVHLAAIQLAKQFKISLHVFEEGYLRPGWVTLEKNGVNAHSSLNKKPHWFINFAKKLTPQAAPQATGKQLKPRAYHDMRYHLASFFLKRQFPHYRTHRPDLPLTEYIGWMKRFPRVFLLHKKQAQHKIKALLNSKQNFYLLPLQLNADAQIKQHSTVNSMSELIAISIASFANKAPENSILVIKNHPLDTGLVDYPALIRQAMEHNNLDAGRVIYLETGDLNTLLVHAKGTVLVNSTVGLSALQANCPTLALGTAIYDMPGLTYQGTLDDFWLDALKKAHRPNADLVDAFRQCVIALTQVNGDFYTKKGIKMAVSGSLERLVSRPRQQSQTGHNSFEPQVYNKA